jgi:hypothetical protein
MPRLPFTLLAAGLAATALAASAQTGPQSPIRSQAELLRYLHATPIRATPLAPLPPASRRRFLARLQFRPHGVDIDYGEPAAELTHPQVVRLYALFGQSPPSGDMGLTPAQQRRRELERVEDAQRRGCAPARCPESEVERRFDELSAIEPRFSLPDAQRFAAEKRDYDRLFGDFFRGPDSLRGLGDPDLRLLTRALYTTLYAVPDAGHVAQLRRVLQEMQRRGMTEDADFEELYGAETGTRQFATAARLREEHPGMHAAPLPAFVPGPAPEGGRPTALSVDVRSDTMRRQAFDLGGPLRIVVIAGCHFSEDAARAIEGDAQLRPLFARHSIWLASPAQPIEDVSAWNRQFGDLPMHVAWRQDEWSMLPSWSMPTYYVFRDGRLAKQFTGWLGTAKLKQALHEAGAL